MKVVKRDGQIVDFDDTRIINAIHKANGDVEEKDGRMRRSCAFHRAGDGVSLG